MKLLKDWKVTTDNKYWYVIENDMHCVRIVFSKTETYYRVEPTNVDLEDEESCLCFIDYEEHVMISEIIAELHGKAMLDKSVPIKVNYTIYKKRTCPRCGNRLFNLTEHKYCSNCGQKVEW